MFVNVIPHVTMTLQELDCERHGDIFSLASSAPQIMCRQVGVPSTLSWASVIRSNRCSRNMLVNVIPHVTKTAYGVRWDWVLTRSPSQVAHLLTAMKLGMKNGPLDKYIAKPLGSERMCALGLLTEMKEWTVRHDTITCNT